MRSAGCDSTCFLPCLKVSRPTSTSLLRYLLVTCGCVSALYSLLLASASWLFRQDTAASVAEAVRLVPYNSNYVTRLAAWHSAQKIALLHRAVKLNPLDYESWIQLGLTSEFQQHDRAAAERYYLKAADVNRMFVPKWTLTNFYFRQERLNDFFAWASATLAVTPYPPDPVFLQIWLISHDARRIARAIPERPRILLPYVWFLSNRHQYALIAPVVDRLIRAVGNRDPWAWGRDDLIALSEDRLIAEGYRDPALNIWASMVKAGWIHKTIPTVSHPITNGDFQTVFFRHGFDWMPVNSGCARVEQFVAAGEVRVRFSGDEPENCIIMQQYVPLRSGRGYRLRWELHSQLPDTVSGLRWHVLPSPVRNDIESISPDLLSSTTRDWDFESAKGAEVGILLLEYSRPLGHLRTKGTAVLKSVLCSAR